MKKLIFGTLIILLFSCNKNDRIVGKWVRIGDPFRGMTIEVTELDNKYVGKTLEKWLLENFKIIKMDEKHGT